MYGRVRELHTPVFEAQNTPEYVPPPRVAWLSMLKWGLIFVVFVLLGYIFLYFSQGIG